MGVIIVNVDILREEGLLHAEAVDCIRIDLYRGIVAFYNAVVFVIFDGKIL